jgi:hypothetical protein
LTASTPPCQRAAPCGASTTPPSPAPLPTRPPLSHQGGAQGAVRSWVHSPASGSLLLNLRGNRWCGRLGRPHRSNGTYVVVDLPGGTWHQRWARRGALGPARARAG